MKERAAYQAASGGQQTAESTGSTGAPPIDAGDLDKPRAKAPL